MTFDSNAEMRKAHYRKVEEHGGAAGGTTNMPEPFPGTPEQASINWFTHRWDGDPDGYCDNCFAKNGRTGSRYPCGADVPRQLVTKAMDGTVVTTRVTGVHV